MIALTDPQDAELAVATLAEHGVRAWVAGEVTEPGDARPGSVTLVGDHPA